MASPSSARRGRVQQLADAVAGSFQAAGFTPVELLQGQITITDLSWQAPPLRSSALLTGIPLYEHLDYPYPVDSRALYDWYRTSLIMLQGGAGEISNQDGYTNLRQAMPTVRPGERAMAFSPPENWPVGDANSGPMLALEAARIFRTSSDQCLGFVDDGDNHYAETPWGPVGIVDGYTSESKDLWDVSCKGYVQAMLEQPRGYATVTCSYDILARLRSALHEQPDRFKEFEGLDYALQALRVFANGNLSKEVQRAVQNMSMRGFKRKQRAAAFVQAEEVMESWDLTDRTKISMLMEILVPGHYSLEMFARKIIDPRKILPAVLSTKVERRILNTIRGELTRARDALETGKAD